MCVVCVRDQRESSCGQKTNVSSGSNHLRLQQGVHISSCKMGHGVAFGTEVIWLRNVRTFEASLSGDQSCLYCVVESQVLWKNNF